MKIDSQGKPLAPPQLRTAENRSSSSSKAGEATLQQDSVQLSSSAGISQGESTFDADKVAAIRQAISEGRFQVKPEAIADGLLDSVKDLLTRQA